MKNKLERKPIKDGDFMPFIAITERFSRAEFGICPQYKKGKLVRLSIYPMQQLDCNYYYEWEGTGGLRTLGIASYNKLDDPKVWLFHYCKEHNCQSMRVYVPNGSKYLWFKEHSDSITIGFVDEKF